MLPVFPAKQSAFIFLVVIAAIMLATLSLSLKGIRAPKIRRLAGLDAIGEALGRAAEMGRPAHYSPGIGGLGTEVAPQTLAGLSVLSYTAEIAARHGVPLWTTIRQAEVQPLAAEVVRVAYIRAGAPEAYNPERVVFLSTAQFAYASGVVGLMHRERVVANIMIGGFWAESLIFAEAGNIVGAIQVAGTANTHQIPFFVAACDYCLIGEEIMAAGAYITKEAAQVGALWGQDYGKLLSIALIVLGLVLAFLGNPALIKLLRGPIW